MSRQVDLSNYLPQVIRDAAEFKAICTAENPELTQVFSCLENVFADQFVLNATENGARRWEKIIEISPVAETLDERKAEIIERMNEQIPYTYRALNKMLIAILGVGECVVDLHPNEYNISIEIYDATKNKKIKDFARRVVPANLTLILRIGLVYQEETYIGLVPYFSGTHTIKAKG